MVLKWAKGTIYCVVAITTRYRLDSSGFEPQWGDIFGTFPDRSRDPLSLLYQGCLVLPGDKAVGSF